MKKHKKTKDPKIGIVGGQAVLEGVMMKSGDRCSLAVRTPDGGIALDNSVRPALRSKYKIARVPLLRGIITFVEQLRLSMSMLTKSAEMQDIDLDEPETKFEKWLADKFGDKLMTFVAGVGTVLGLVLGIGLFLMLPTFAAKGIDMLSGGFVGRYSVLRSLIEGLIRIAIFVGYVWGVSLLPDIRRTYEYHGAEHKSVACFEAGLDLVPENARGCTRFHPRCGTSFIFVMLIISIIVNSFLTWNNVWIRFGLKLLMIPLIVGVGYEFIRYAGGHSNIFTKIVSAPGLWMQRITTREPDDSQLEVALAALKNAIPVEFGGIVQPSCKLDAHGGIVTENEEEPDAADTDDAEKEPEEGADGAEGALPTEGAVDTNDPNTDSAEHDA
ncbi:MAG: DUF1385 domain-containing protein [Clostridia bacterium]|nr:DUF1385 domain-containing protein [Clostridia bacterium]